MNTTAHGDTAHLPMPISIRTADDLRGIAQLLVRGVAATTDLTEAVHANILASIFALPRISRGRQPSTTTRGISRIAYQGVRKLSGLLGNGLDDALAALAPQLGQSPPFEQRTALLAVLNGVLGDHLLASGNPLALQADLQWQNQSLTSDATAWSALSTAATPRILVQVHGLCMTPQQWCHRGHDHGQHLAAAQGYTVLHLHYNSGLSIHDNGRVFSDLLQPLLERWPVPVERFVILGHSMGGLVARAAIATATQQQQTWVTQLDQLVCLGTPHLGAPLERAGNALQTALGLSPWTAPFVRLGQLRSAGIQDLRHGLCDATQVSGKRSQLQLPAHIRAYAVAGSTQTVRSGSRHPHLRGDGLVPVRSALGEHPDAQRALHLPAAHRLLVERTGHLELLSSPQVYAQLQRWLA